jgi:hypothetical protein
VKLAVTWRSPTRRELRRLDPPEQRRLIAAVERGKGDAPQAVAPLKRAMTRASGFPLLFSSEATFRAR